MLRAGNVGALYQAIAALTPQKSTMEWTRLFHAASIPAMPVRDIADIRQDPHLQATDFFARREHPTEGAYFDMKSPVRFGAAPECAPGPAPTIGEHTAAIRAELGQA